jgi:hypothetical protein
LSHLVSVLRDLITCKVESDDDEGQTKGQRNDGKLHELYANIVNVLTNMPSACFDELLTPVLANPLNSAKFFAPGTSPDTTTNKLKQKNMSIRIAQTIKRNTRTSKRKSKNSVGSSPRGSTKSKDDKKTWPKVPVTQEECDWLTLMSPDEDLEFEGKNVEAVAIILSFMSQSVGFTLFLFV